MMRRGYAIKTFFTLIFLREEREGGFATKEGCYTTSFTALEQNYTKIFYFLKFRINFIYNRISLKLLIQNINTLYLYSIYFIFH